MILELHIGYIRRSARRHCARRKACRIYQDVADGETFPLLVQWKARTSPEHYLQSGSGMALVGAIDAVSEKAGFKTAKDGAWQGIDILKKIRKR